MISTRMWSICSQARGCRTVLGRLEMFFSEGNSNLQKKANDAVRRRIQSLKCSESHLQTMDHQIRELATLEDYDSLVDTYKADLEILHSNTNTFARKLDTRDELAHLRYRYEKKEKSMFRHYNVFAIMLLGIGIAIISAFYYNWSRTKLRLPRVIKLFWKLRLLSSDVLLLPNPEVNSQAELVLKVVEDYVDSDKSISIKNCHADLRILNILAQMDITPQISERYMSVVLHVLADLQTHKELYKLQLEARKLFEPLRGLTRRVSKFSLQSPDKLQTTVLCQLIDTLMLYLPETTFTLENEVEMRMEVLHMFAHLKRQKVITPEDVPTDTARAFQALEMELNKFVWGLASKPRITTKGMLTEHVGTYLVKKLVVFN